MTEMWKPIPGYEGIYEASNKGRIRTAPGKTTANARYSVRVWKSRVLKPKREVCKKRQDLRVSLWKNGVVKDHLVSRLVASAWHGAPCDGMTVNHINGIWSDNSAENLEWITLSENIKKGFESGCYSSICVPITLIDMNGVEHNFRSMAKASIFLDRSDSYISNLRKRREATAVSASGASYTFVAG